MNTVVLTPTQARRLAVTKQRLAGPRPDPTPDGIVDLVRALGCLQIDPIRAVERTQYLVLWSRLGQYDTEHLHTAMWEDRRLFEYWAHAASIVLTENLPIHRSQMQAARSGGKWRRQSRDWVREHPELHEQVLEALRDNPPLSSDQLAEVTSAQTRGDGGSGWGSRSDVNWMLYHLWTLGEVTVARRDGLRRSWTLTGRWLPGWAPLGPSPDRDIVWLAAQISLKALGVATPPHIRKHFVRGHYGGLPEALASLVDDGLVARARVEDAAGPWPGDWYVHSEDLPLLEKIDEDQTPRTVLLSPFDNLICDRARTLRMWNFDFTMEIYVPKSRRKWGYYVMPILHGDTLVGRVDPRMDRKSGALIVHSVYAEDHAKDDVLVAQSLARSVDDLAAFLGASRVKYGRRKPAAWRPHLRGHRVGAVQ